MKHGKLKRCPRCGEWRGPDGFHRNWRSPDRLSSQCRDCRNTYGRWHRRSLRVRERTRQLRKLRALRDRLIRGPVIRRTEEEKREMERAAERRHYARHRPAQLQRVARYEHSPAGKAAWQARRRRYRQDARYSLDEAAGAAVRRAVRGQTFSSIWRGRFGFDAKTVREHMLNTLPKGCRAVGAQVDHVIPKARFTYASADDAGFTAAWSLQNLRLLPPAWHRTR